MIVSPESLRECPNGLFVTTVDGRFDARGMPARPSEQSDTGLDDHPLRTPSLNVALRVQRCPRSCTCTSARPPAQRPGRNTKNTRDEKRGTPPTATLRPGVQRGPRCVSSPPQHRQSRDRHAMRPLRYLGVPLSRGRQIIRQPPRSHVSRAGPSCRGFLCVTPDVRARSARTTDNRKSRV